MGIRNAKRKMSLRADQALEVASLLSFFENLQLDLKAAIKQDGDWYKRFMPLSEMVSYSLSSKSCYFNTVLVLYTLFHTSLLQIMLPVINRSFIKLVEQIIDVDGKIKDSAVCSFSHSLTTASRGMILMLSYIYCFRVVT